MNLAIDVDDAFAARIETTARARGMTSREFIRAALDQALAAPLASSEAPPAFVQKTHDFGAHSDTTWTVLADLESDEHLRKNPRK
jgi:hypothetical protein